MTHAVTPAPTPNPNAMRFTFAVPVLGSASHNYANVEAAKGVAWAEKIFGVPGVASLFGVNEFLTVTKTNEAAWETVVPHVLDILRDADL